MVVRCSTMPGRKAKSAPVPALDINPSGLHLLKRAQLQQHCKRLGLGAVGKNTDLLQKLRHYLKQNVATVQPASPRSVSPERTSPSVKERGECPCWCVIHGTPLTAAAWVKLTPRCGRLGVITNESFVPLHLTPSSLPVPQGFEDNLICGECLERNNEKESHSQKASTGQERQSWCVIHGHLLTTSKWAQLSLCRGRAGFISDGAFVPLRLTPSSLPVPQGFEDNLLCGECLERNKEKESSLRKESTNQDENCPPTGNPKSLAASASRSRNKSARFQPREDPVYARKVDELLGQLAMGQVDSEKVLQPIHPAVVHSPLTKQEGSPVSISRRRSVDSI